MLQLRACVSVLCAQTNALNKKLIRCENEHCFHTYNEHNSFKLFDKYEFGLADDLVFCYKYN